jgi:hypothetical protein
MTPSPASEYVPRTSQSLWHPPSYGDLVPFAATVLHHSRLPSLALPWYILIPNRCRLSQRCLLHFPSAKWVLTSAVNSTNVSNNSVTITETGSNFSCDVFSDPPLGAGLWICPRTSQSLWYPPSHGDLVPFAVTVLHHSRLPSLDLP